MTRSGRLYQRRRHLGQCVRCRRPVSPVGGRGPAVCLKCADKVRTDTAAAVRVLRERRQAREECRDCACGVVTTNPTTGLLYTRCLTCRSAQAALKQQQRDARVERVRQVA